MFALRALLRELRGGELTILIAAMVVAVTAMTAVGFFTDRVGRAVKAQAAEVLAADLVVRSPAPLDPKLRTEATKLGLASAEAVAFPSVVLSGNDNTLATIQAVSPGYPLRGEVRISDALFGAGVRAGTVPGRGEAWAEPALLGKLGLDVGATVQVGSATFRVAKALQYQPDQNPGFANLAPSLLINIADVPAMNVIRPGSRVTYRQLYAGEEPQIARFREIIAGQLDSEAVIRGREDAGEQINAAIDRAQRFLSLASLVTVVLAAVATAMAARRYALRHLDAIALMKSIGATQGFVQVVSIVQLVIVVMLATLAGSLLGFAAQTGLAMILGGLMNVSLPPAAPTAAWLGLVTAATVAIGFAMPHLLMLRRTPPLRVLRHDLPPPQLATGLTYLVAVAALVAMIYAIVREARLVSLIVVGLSALAAVAGLAGWALIVALRRFRGAAGVAWRYGLANISRRGAESVVQIVAFGLGLMVLLLLTVVRTDLLAEWKRTLAPDAPNFFMINVAPELAPRIGAVVRENFGHDPYFLPFIRGRMLSINGTPVERLRLREVQAAGLVRRETNLTWTARLPGSNQVREGVFWPSDYRGPPQLSVEAGMAKNLGLHLGDKITFNVGGEEFTAPVTSLRFVEWDSFQPNFFFLLSPGLAEELAQTWIGSFYVPPDRRPLLNTLVRQFPGVTLLDLEMILAQVRNVIDRASLAVQYVFLFTLVAGLMVMLAAVQITGDERRFESAILRALGAERVTILQGVAIEFTVLGALSGVLAALGATAIGLVLAERVFNLTYTVSPLLWPAGLAFGSLLVGVTGTLATRGAVNEPPVRVLREG